MIQVGKGSVGGLGAGARITPTAILVIKNGEVTMLPIKGKCNLETPINILYN